MESSEESPVLVCTVGGSHAPVVTAIRKHRPKFVWFVCTDGKAGSVLQITGAGNCIKQSRSDRAPSLPNIPAQTGLGETQHAIKIVPPDNPDLIHAEIRSLLKELVSSHPNRRIIVDYTGGTKSMTAALLLAGLEFGTNVELWMVAGQRADLLQVTDGTEIPVPANVDRIRFFQQRGVALAPWKYFGFGEAAVALEGMQLPRDTTDREYYLAALAASRAFAAWDRFDHVLAKQLLQPLGDRFGRYLAALGNLTRDNDRRTPAQLLDLHWNLQRRAHQQKHDDAVGRSYRLLEWTAQWLLQRDAGIDTSDVKVEQQAGVPLPQRDDGTCFAGLQNAWEMLKTCGNVETQVFAKRTHSRLKSLLTIRNHSILAHGFTPITESEWQQWDQWTDQDFLPFLTAEAQRSGIKNRPPQLPTEFPEACP